MGIDPHVNLMLRGICTCCHQSHSACVARAPDDVGRHDAFYRANNVTASRPWWSARELVRILEAADYRNGYCDWYPRRLV